MREGGVKKLTFLRYIIYGRLRILKHVGNDSYVNGYFNFLTD